MENCYECHSTQSKKVKGGLRLDSREGLVHGGDSGPVIVPGEPEKSVLIKAVRYTDKDLQMPPKDKKLPDNQIADLVEWVKLGAPDPRTSSAPTSQTSGPPPTNAAYDVAAARKQWALQPPKNPPIRAENAMADAARETER